MKLNLKKSFILPENTINLGIGFSDHRLANDCIDKFKMSKKSMGL